MAVSFIPVVAIENESDYRVIAASLNGGAAVKITVYLQDETTVLASGEAAGVGKDAIVLFKAAAGSYFIKVEPLQTNLVGTGAVYAVTASEVELSFLPLVAR